MISIIDCFLNLIINSIGFLVQPMMSFLLPLGFVIFGVILFKSILG